MSESIDLWLLLWRALVLLWDRWPKCLSEKNNIGYIVTCVEIDFYVEPLHMTCSASKNIHTGKSRAKTLYTNAQTQLTLEKFQLEQVWSKCWNYDEKQSGVMLKIC